MKLKLLLLLMLVCSNVWAFPSAIEIKTLDSKSIFAQNQDTMIINVSAYQLLGTRYYRYKSYYQSYNMMGCAYEIEYFLQPNPCNDLTNYSYLHGKNGWSYNSTYKQWTYKQDLKLPNYWGYGTYNLCFYEPILGTQACKTLRVE